MPFSHIRSQETAIATLTRALQSGRVHHAYRFEGPDGVGKELAAFALAQALLCTGGDPLGCGQCSACKRAVTMGSEEPHVPQHPDLTLIERGLYAPEIIGTRNREVSEISVHQIRRLVIEHASFSPHEGRARVFIFRRADELSTGAANALLKILEEPRQGTHFILLSSRAERLLTTIRSRSMPIRFGPLPDALIRDILAARNIQGDQSLTIELAAGSASAAIELSDPELTKSRDDFVEAILSAAEAKDLGAAVEFAEKGDRDKAELQQDLRALSATLARRARAAMHQNPAGASAMAQRYELVARTISRLERNASPTLSLVSLVAEMREIPTFGA